MPDDLTVTGEGDTLVNPHPYHGADAELQRQDAGGGLYPRQPEDRYPDRRQGHVPGRQRLRVRRAEGWPMMAAPLTCDLSLLRPVGGDKRDGG